MRNFLQNMGIIMNCIQDNLKKKHPCGSFDWEVLRSGADFRLKCCGCTHQVMMARKLVEKNIRRLERDGEEVKIVR